MKSIARSLCIILAFLFLFVACSDEIASTAAVNQSAPEPEPTQAPAVEAIVVEVTAVPVDSAVATEVPTPEPTPVPTETPTPEPTEVPTPSPVPTRAPMEGDIATVNFPTYDTGEDADYSYQSDELRIAIKVVKDAEQKQTYYIADIWMRSLNSFRTVFAKGEYGKGTEEGDVVATKENAILAVNGSYNQGLTVHAGTRYKRARAMKGWNSQAYCVIYKDGTMKSFLIKNNDFDLDKELKNGAWHAWQFGPIVIQGGEYGPDYNKYNLGYKARNILGYYEPGHYVIVTCDAGRKNDAIGMNEEQMAALMKSLGVQEAFNLDGGTSAVMVFMGEIINRPTMRNDNGKSVSGRPILDMLTFAEYDAEGNAPDLSTITPAKTKGN